MKTLQGWNDKGGDLRGYVKPKDEIDDNMFFYFLEVLPPRIMLRYGFLVGEPVSHNNDGKAVYDAFYESPDGKRFVYGGCKTVKEFRTEGL